MMVHGRDRILQLDMYLPRVNREGHLYAISGLPSDIPFSSYQYCPHTHIILELGATHPQRIGRRYGRTDPVHNVGILG